MNKGNLLAVWHFEVVGRGWNSTRLVTTPDTNLEREVGSLVYGLVELGLNWYWREFVQMGQLPESVPVRNWPVVNRKACLPCDLQHG